VNALTPIEPIIPQQEIIPTMQREKACCLKNFENMYMISDITKEVHLNFLLQRNRMPTSSDQYMYISVYMNILYAYTQKYHCNFVDFLYKKFVGNTN